MKSLENQDLNKVKKEVRKKIYKQNNERKKNHSLVYNKHSLRSYSWYIIFPEAIRELN